MMRYSVPVILTLLGMFEGMVVQAAKLTCDCAGAAPVKVEVDGSCPSDSEVDAACRQACSANGLGFEDASCSNDCLGEHTLLYSCTAGHYVEAGDIQVGDSVRVMTPKGHVCSDVYYKFQHEGKYAAYSFTVEGMEEPIVVSENHLVYVGEAFGTHQPTRAKNVQVGDTLISSKEGGPKEVVAINTTFTGLVNVLTMEPSLELENGIIISAHSYEESLYAYPFLPFKLLYKALGAPTMDGIMENEKTKAGLIKMDYYMGYGIDLLSLS